MICSLLTLRRKPSGIDSGFVPEKTNMSTRAKATDERTKGKKAEGRNFIELSADILASQK